MKEWKNKIKKRIDLNTYCIFQSILHVYVNVYFNVYHNMNYIRTMNMLSGMRMTDLLD
jgi:hypothetical protein